MGSYSGVIPAQVMFSSEQRLILHRDIQLHPGLICIPKPSIAKAALHKHKELQSINIYSLKVKIALNHSSLFGEQQL